jgi:hypothetical protein
VSVVAMKNRPSNPSRVFIGYIVDVVAPMATYFLLNALGVPPLLGMAFGCAVALASTARNTFIQRKIDRVGLLVVLEVAVSVGLMFLIKDPRLLMAKPAVYMEIGGFYLLATSIKGKPMNYEGVRGMAARKDPARGEAVDKAWDESPRFRSMVRMSAIAWGIAFIADGVLRILVVYSVGVQKAWLLSNVPHMIIICLLIVFSALAGKRMAALVDAQG